jgi:hypothetical protein
LLSMLIPLLPIHWIPSNPSVAFIVLLDPVLIVLPALAVLLFLFPASSISSSSDSGNLFRNSRRNLSSDHGLKKTCGFYRFKSNNEYKGKWQVQRF